MIAMRGYPKLFFKRDASTPAVNAPINAAAAGGNAARSTSSSLNVLAMAPITAADAAKGIGLLTLLKNQILLRSLLVTLEAVVPLH